MEKQPVHPTNKNEALKALGVVSKKERRALAGRVEFVTVRHGRHVLARSAYMPTILIGVSGSVRLRAADTSEGRIDGPFVIDTWAADDRRVSEISAQVESDRAALVLVDWRHRDAIFRAVPALHRLSKATRQVLVDQASEVIDVRSVSTDKPVAPGRTGVVAMT